MFFLPMDMSLVSLDVWFILFWFCGGQKRKIQEESGSNAEAAPVFPTRVIRQFRQKKSVNNEISESKPGLSTDVLASVSTFYLIF